MTLQSTTLRLGTRGSLLARMQSQLVADELARLHPGLTVELVLIKTTGDRVTDRPLADMGGKGLFTKEIEEVLLAREVDFAVHSFKDVPVTMPLVDGSGLTIAAVPMREDPRDVLVMRDPSAGALGRNAVVGTTSLRRQCQILAFAPGVTIKPVRGNIDTRLRKLREGEFDALVLAMAGLKRAGLYERSFMSPLDPQDLLPAAGQGALALQCRKDDRHTVERLLAMNDEVSAICVAAEREVVRQLNGDCHSPIGALATVDGARTLSLRVAVGAQGGYPPVRWAHGSGDMAEARAVAERVVRSL